MIYIKWFQLIRNPSGAERLRRTLALWLCSISGPSRQAGREGLEVEKNVVDKNHTETNLCLQKGIVTGRLDNISDGYSTNERKDLMAPQRETCKICWMSSNNLECWAHGIEWLMCRRLLDLDVFAGVIPPRDELLQDLPRIFDIFVSVAKL